MNLINRIANSIVLSGGLMLCSAGMAADIYVSLSGRDANSGTEVMKWTPLVRQG